MIAAKHLKSYHRIKNMVMHKILNNQLLDGWETIRRDNNINLFIYRNKSSANESKYVASIQVLYVDDAGGHPRCIMDYSSYNNSMMFDAGINNKQALMGLAELNLWLEEV